MTIVTSSTGAIVRRSRNLRGLLDHARTVAPEAIILTDTDGQFLTSAEAGQEVRRYCVDVRFANGDYGRTFFADWRIAADWFRARRSWGTLPVHGDPRFIDRYNAA